MRRKPFAYARLGNWEKSSASISARRDGRIFVMRAASSRVKFLASLASWNFLPRPSIVIRGPAKRRHQDRPKSRAVSRLRRDLKYRAVREYQRCVQPECILAAGDAGVRRWKLVFPGGLSRGISPLVPRPPP